MNKLDIRKKILHLRKKKYSRYNSIQSNVVFKLFKNIDIKSKIIGAYYPFNYEIDILNILKIL